MSLFLRVPTFFISCPLLPPSARSFPSTFLRDFHADMHLPLDDRGSLGPAKKVNNMREPRNERTITARDCSIYGR